MSVFKCKMCGGTLSVQNGVSVAECEYCGTKQTLPTSNDESIINLFNRANYLRQKSEYDKASDVYEKILDLDNTQAEAHWGLVLCKYGVEYVEDPLNKERIPTCHRTQMESILADADYRAVIENADVISRSVYEKQAQEINELQKKILQIVKSEKPFDVFICYKETDESGVRTRDSVIANEIYHELTNSGLKVFFAAITLEDKLGQEYEPYIFAALTSAKVMLVLGTKEDYFKAVWVRNEWSRYLHLMKTDRQTKRTLIPCFRDMDAYALPDEFAHLQALDMSSIAFMPDLTRNIRKLLGVSQSSNATQQNTTSSIPQYEPSVQIAPLLKRAFMVIEDGEFEQANGLLETVLNNDPENAKAYLGKFMCDLHVKNEEEIVKMFTIDALQNPNYKKACRFADENLKTQLEEYPYLSALSKMHNREYAGAITIFQSIGWYKDASVKVKECRELQNQTLYEDGLMRMKAREYLSAAGIFMKLQDYRDAAEKVKECERLDTEEENQFIYMRGISFLNDNKYAEAIEEFEKIQGFKDASELHQRCRNTIHEMELSKKRKELILGTLGYSLFSVPICGIIGLVIGFVKNVLNLFSASFNLAVWDWGLCINFGLIACVIGLVIGFILSYFDL